MPEEVDIGSLCCVINGRICILPHQIADGAARFSIRWCRDELTKVNLIDTAQEYYVNSYAELGLPRTPRWNFPGVSLEFGFAVLTKTKGIYSCKA